jgi:hypothetical protein
VCALLAAGAWAQPVPKKYQPLYHELDGQLRTFELRLPPASSGKTPIRAAALLGADCHRGEIMLADAQREATLRELDALKNLGAEGIVLGVCYPLLTAAFHEPQPYLDYYANLANEVRSRGMKLLVEHTTMLRAYAPVDVRPYYRKLTKPRFTRERFGELKTILIALQPDYLTLVSEPRAQAAGQKLSIKEWRNYVRRSVDTLTQQLGAFPTLLGAGCGLWEELESAEAFAGIKGLGYIDLHLYPLSSAGKNNLERMLTWPDRIRAIDPDKRILMSGLWLYKAGEADVAHTVGDPRVVARDVYSFWAPLDQRFLRIAGIAAREKGIELVAPSGPGYFFAYLDYDDPLTFRLRPKDLVNLASQRTYEAILRNAVTDTGLAFRDM